MGFVIGILVAIAGAVMRWAVTTTPTGFSIQEAGSILLVGGVVILVISAIQWAVALYQVDKTRSKLDDGPLTRRYR